MSDDNVINSVPPEAELTVLPIGLIDDPERAMRSEITAESIADLVMSIKMVGLIEPLVVRRRADRYEIVAGHRRITACEAAGLQEVPCYVVTGTQEQVEMMKIHENLYRQDINPFDEAKHYSRLMQEMKLTPMRVARIINRSEGYVRERLEILSMDPLLQQGLSDGKLNISVAKQLHRIKDPIKLREMTGYAVNQGITGALARRWVDENLPQENQPQAPPVFQGDIPDVTPASEQHTQCFWCLQEVRLYDAMNVFVHDQCHAHRMQVATEEATEDEQLAPASN